MGIPIRNLEENNQQNSSRISIPNLNNPSILNAYSTISLPNRTHYSIHEYYNIRNIINISILRDLYFIKDMIENENRDIDLIYEIVNDIIQSVNTSTNISRNRVLV